MKRSGYIIIGLLLAAAAVTYVIYRQSNQQPAPVAEQRLNEAQLSTVTTIAGNLDTPWAIGKRPGGQFITSERSGTVRTIGANGQSFTIADVVEQGEGGLLGLTLHPDFTNQPYVYIYKTTDNQTNVVERYRLQDDQLSDKDTIIQDIPAAQTHNGGEIKFGPDNKLYITTGDANAPNDAQNTSRLNGKILRLNDDGSVPADNPFNNPVWSYGHRNPQGLAWDDQGRLWSTEHGPSGSETGYDELNQIQKGGNYGWPLIRGDQTRNGLIAPVAQSGANDTWAPAGLAYANGSLYFAGLRGQTLYQARINSATSVTLTKHLSDEYGRLRSILVDDQRLIIGTSNRDGRGTPQDGDDKLLSIPLSIL